MTRGPLFSPLGAPCQIAPLRKNHRTRLFPKQQALTGPTDRKSSENAPPKGGTF